MDSNQLNILDLNDYCLVRVLEYLDTEDRVNFAQVCSRFREVLRDWSYVLYPEFTIQQSGDYEPDDVKWQLKLFLIVSDVIRKLYLDLRKVTAESPVSKCMDNLCTQIKTMESLEYFALDEGGSFLSVLSNKSKSGNLQNTEKILDALQFAPKIKSVSVKCKTNSYSATSLIQMKCLQEISINTNISSADLVDICKSNANLRVLWLREVTGDFMDIVPHCQNLEEIAFPILANHESYAALAELPNLKKIIIKGSTVSSPCAKTMELFSAFAAKKEQTKLESFIILTGLNLDETIKLCELKHLKELRCTFDDVNCIDLLAELSELEGLYIMLGRTDAGSRECLNILRSCQNLQRLHINSNLTIDFVTKALEVLRKVRNPKKQKPLELYSTGVMYLCNEEGEKLVDNVYCTLVNRSPHLRTLPWRFSN